MVLAIIDHDNHQLFIEVAPDTYIDRQEEYIKEKYGFKDGDTWSWDYLGQRIEVFGDQNVVEGMVHFNK